jgi:hypothetical protein
MKTGLTVLQSGSVIAVLNVFWLCTGSGASMSVFPTLSPAHIHNPTSLSANQDLGTHMYICNALIKELIPDPKYRDLEPYPTTSKFTTATAAL